jgi:hypothetical protein
MLNYMAKRALSRPSNSCNTAVAGRARVKSFERDHLPGLFSRGSVAISGDIAGAATYGWIMGNPPKRRKAFVVAEKHPRSPRESLYSDCMDQQQAGLEGSECGAPADHERLRRLKAIETLLMPV